MNFSFVKKHFFICIFLILNLALLVRVFDINKNPPGFFCDEAAIGYNAYKLLTTGADEYGVKFPFFFQSFGDYRLPIPIYANIPLTAILGMTEMSVRLTAVLFGVLSILFIILLGKELINETVGILMGFFTSVIPWHIQLSRWGSEYIYFPAVFSIAFYFYLKSFKKLNYFPISLFFFALTMYTYYPSLIVVPIFIFFASILFLYKIKDSYKWKIFAVGFFVFFMCCIPLLVAFHNGTLLTRWNSVSQPTLSLGDRISQFSQFYVQHFSPDFLFLKGDLDLPGHFITRHSVRGFGELYLFQFPLIIIGLGFALFKKRTKELLLMFLLLFLYPIGSSITSDGPLATRSVIGIIPLVFFSALGLEAIFEMKFLKISKKNFFAFGFYIFFFIILEMSLFKYFGALYEDYPKYSADFWGWQFGAKDITAYFIKEENSFDDEIMAPEFNAPEIFFKFYAPNDCKKCKVGLPDQLYDPNRKQLFALTPQYLNEHPQWKLLTYETIYYPNRAIAFLIGEIVQ